MTQRMTVTDYLLYELNRMARDRGDDVELVWDHPERPKPQLATRDGDVVHLPPRPQQKGDHPE
jgi:hypothetical protein